LIQIFNLRCSLQYKIQEMLFDSILNQYRDDEEPEEAQTIVIRQPSPLFVCPKVDVARLYGSIADADLRLTAEEGRTAAFLQEQALQASEIQLLQGEQTVQDDAILSLQSGLLQRLYFQDIGGAHLLLKSAEEFADPVTGAVALIPSSAVLETYDAVGDVEASVLLQGDLVTLSRDVRVEGELILNEKSVAEQLLSIEDKLSQYAIELAVGVASDVGQNLLLAALSAYSARPPAGYTALPEDTFPDPDLEDSTRVPPFKLFPAGQFDNLGPAGEVLATRVNLKGKATLNAPETLATRVWEVHGDALYKKLDSDDEYEVEYQCKLGSKVAVLDAQLQLTNPDAVCVRLGTNALITAAGKLNAAEVSVDSITSGSVNGISTSRLVQRHAPSVDAQLNKRVAKVFDTALAARRAAGKPVLTRSSDADVLRLHDEVLSVKRAYARPVLTKSSDADVLRLHDEVLSVKRAYARPVLSKSYDKAVVALSTDTLALKRAYARPVLSKSSDVAVVALSTDTLALKRGAYTKQTVLPVLNNSRQLAARSSA
jgi:hypothetical protein